MNKEFVEVYEWRSHEYVNVKEISEKRRAEVELLLYMHVFEYPNGNML
jgi:hypothetical protein